MYFHFGQPIDTTRFDGRHHDDDAARALRDEARAAVEHGLDLLFTEREADPQRSLTARLTEPRVPDQAVSDPAAPFVSRAFDAWDTTGPEAAAAWRSRWAELTDPPVFDDARRRAIDRRSARALFPRLARAVPRG